MFSVAQGRAENDGAPALSNDKLITIKLNALLSFFIFLTLNNMISNYGKNCDGKKIFDKLFAIHN